MKHVQKIDEINAKWNKDEDRFHFDNSEVDNTATFYLHKGKQGFAMDIHVDDRKILEELLKRNNIDHTISEGNVLPF